VALLYYYFCVPRWKCIYLWIRGPALLEHRTKVGAVDEKETGEKIVQIIAVLGSILIAVIPALDYRFGWSHVPLYILLFWVPFF
jgi:hypothetical protein